METATYEDNLVNVRQDAAPEGTLLMETAFWTATQVRNHLDIAPMTLHRWIKRGRVQVTVFDGRYYFTREQVNMVARHCRIALGLPGDLREREIGDPTYLETVQLPPAPSIHDLPPER